MSIGIWQLILILLIVLVLFGAGKLPRVMNDLGKGIRTFRQSMDGEEEDKNSKTKNPKKQSAPRSKKK